MSLMGGQSPYTEKVLIILESIDNTRGNIEKAKNKLLDMQRNLNRLSASRTNIYEEIFIKRKSYEERLAKIQKMPRDDMKAMEKGVLNSKIKTEGAYYKDILDKNKISMDNKRNEMAQQREYISGLGEKLRMQNREVEMSTKGYSKDRAAEVAKMGFLDRLFRTKKDDFKRDMVYGMHSQTKLGRAGEQLRMLAGGTGGFQMAWLGVMFTGMSLQKVLGGLLKPAQELVGIFEVMSATLQLLFLPTALMMLETIFIPLLEFVLALSPEMQLLIGNFTLFGMVVGLVMLLVGQFMLGLASVAILTGMTGGAIVEAFVGIIPAIIALVAVVAILFVAWQTNFLGIRQITGAAVQMIGIAMNALFKIFGPLTASVYGMFVTLNEVRLGNVTGALVKGQKASASVMVGFQDLTQGIVDFGKDLMASGEEMDENSRKQIENKNYVSEATRIYENVTGVIKDNSTAMETNTVKIDKTVSGFNSANSEMDTTVSTLQTLSGGLNNDLNPSLTTSNEKLDSIYEKLTLLDGKTSTSYHTIEEKTVQVGSFSSGGGSGGAGSLYGYDVVSPSNVWSFVALRNYEEFQKLKPPSAGYNWIPKYRDFIWRAGSGPIAISPNDTIVGREKPGNSGNNINFNPQVTIQIDAESNVDIDELKRQLGDTWINELRSMIR